MEPAVGSVVRTSELLVLTTLGRLLRRGLRLKIEARDRLSARTGPHSRLPSLEISGGIIHKKNSEQRLRKSLFRAYV